MNKHVLNMNKYSHNLSLSKW